MLVCGNLLSWGMHGVAFAPNEDTAALWPAIAEALYRLRRADKLLGNTDLIMVKDIPDPHAAGAAAFRDFPTGNSKPSRTWSWTFRQSGGPMKTIWLV